MKGNKEEVIKKLLKYNNTNYVIEIKEKENKLVINIDEEESDISEDYFSIEYSFEELLNLGKSFKQCENIKDVFLTIKNTLSSIKEYSPQSNIIMNNNMNNNNYNTLFMNNQKNSNQSIFSNALTQNNFNINTGTKKILIAKIEEDKEHKKILHLDFTSKLSTGKLETIKIQLNNIQKDIYQIFKNLRQKYLMLRPTVQDNYDENGNIWK